MRDLETIDDRLSADGDDQRLLVYDVQCGTAAEFPEFSYV